MLSLHLKSIACIVTPQILKVYFSYFAHLFQPNSQGFWHDQVFLMSIYYINNLKVISFNVKPFLYVTNRTHPLNIIQFWQRQIKKKYKNINQ